VALGDKEHGPGAAIQYWSGVPGMGIDRKVRGERVVIADVNPVT
jgi:hypothetical protein